MWDPEWLAWKISSGIPLSLVLKVLGMLFRITSSHAQLRSEPKRS